MSTARFSGPMVALRGSNNGCKRLHSAVQKHGIKFLGYPTFRYRVPQACAHAAFRTDGSRAMRPRMLSAKTSMDSLFIILKVCLREA